MLMYGSATMADYVFDKPNIKICNLTSLAERYSNYRIPLMPPHNLGSSNEYEFDVNYMHWILDNDYNFVIFMQNIIIPLYTGIDVFLIISDDEWSEIISESLLKLIQQRYGVIAVYAKEVDDVLYAEECNFAEGYGIFNLDTDVERFEKLIYQANGQTGIADDYYQ